MSPYAINKDSSKTETTIVLHLDTNLNPKTTVASGKSGTKEIRKQANISTYFFMISKKSGILRT